MLNRITNDPEFIVCASDKNLDLVIMERSEYICRAQDDHLLDEKNYLRMTLREIKFLDLNLRTKVNRIFRKGVRDELLKRN